VAGGADRLSRARRASWPELEDARRSDQRARLDQPPRQDIGERMADDIQGAAVYEAAPRAM